MSGDNQQTPEIDWENWDEHDGMIYGKHHPNVDAGVQFHINGHDPKVWKHTPLGFIEITTTVFPHGEAGLHAAMRWCQLAAEMILELPQRHGSCDVSWLISASTPPERAACAQNTAATGGGEPVQRE